MVTRDLWAGKEDTKIEKLTLHLLHSQHTPGQHHRGSTRNYYKISKEWDSLGHPIPQIQIKQEAMLFILSLTYLQNNTLKNKVCLSTKYVPGFFFFLKGVK